ncbi:MAG: alpha/beta fold hydrolase [Planctomycetota bacterium]
MPLRLSTCIGALSLVAALGVTAASAAVPVIQQLGSGDQTVLERRGSFGIGLGWNAEGLPAISAIDPRGAAAIAGIEIGDVVLRVGEQTVEGAEQVQRERVFAVRAGAPIKVAVRRNGVARTFIVTPKEAPSGSLGGAGVVAGSVRTPQGLARTFVSVPNDLGRNEKRPAVFLIQGSPCISIELQPGPSWMRRVLQPISDAGYVTFRVEKPGVGDSQGVGCAACGFEDELTAYEAGLEQLLSLDFVDPERVVIFGFDIGGMVAPILASDAPVAGIATFGAPIRSWHEQLMHRVRSAFESTGSPQFAVEDRMLDARALLSKIFSDDATRVEILDRHPEFDELLSQTLIGSRSPAYHRQLDRRNVAAAWEGVLGPVLLLHGEFDAMTPLDESRRIADMLNEFDSGRASLIVLPGMDHLTTVHGSALQARQRPGQGDTTDALTRTFLVWMEGLVAREVHPPIR